MNQRRDELLIGPTVPPGMNLACVRVCWKSGVLRETLEVQLTMRRMTGR